MDHTQEKWIIWEKADVIGLDYNMTDFSYILSKGIEVLFENFVKNRKIKIFFDYVEYFCFTEEGASASLLIYRGEKFREGALGPSNVFQVFNSSLSKFVYNEALKAVTWKPEDLKHFIFLNDEGVYQVLSREEPKIIFLD